MGFGARMAEGRGQTCPQRSRLRGGRGSEDTPVEFPWGNPIQPQYHLPELPWLNTLRCPSELNGARRGGLGKEGRGRLATDVHTRTQTFIRRTSPDKKCHRFAKKIKNKRYKTRPG